MSASIWLVVTALLFAPALTDVCAAVCATPEPAATARATRPAATGADHCASMAGHADTPPQASSSHTSSPQASMTARRGAAPHTLAHAVRAPHTLSMPAVLVTTHRCLLHARSGAPLADEARTTAIPRTASSDSARDLLNALATAPAALDTVLVTVLPVHATSPFDTSPQSVRAAARPARSPLRI